MGGKAVNAVDDVLDSAPDLGVDSPQPAHVRIEQWLTAVIGAGGLVPGDKLPREETLAAALGVSRMTLRQALATLEGLGAIVRKPGRLGGTFVAEPKIVCDLTGLAGFTEQMRRAQRARRRARGERDDQAGEPCGGAGARARPRRDSCTRSSGCARPTASRWRSRTRAFPPRCSPTCSPTG